MKFLFLSLVFSSLLSSTGLAASSLDDAVADFEALGGKGKWFQSVMPERLGGEPGRFYLVKSLPARASRRAKIWLLRTAQTFGALRDVLVREGAPVILGSIPEATQVQAAALGGFQLAKDALRVAGVRDKKTIMLLTEQTSIYTLAHENRHWLDYENTAFMKELNGRIGEFVSSHGLDARFAPLLVQITIEIRGHITQARQALKSLSEGWPFIDRAGNLRKGGEAARSDYEFERNQARVIFEQAYLPYLGAIFGKLSEARKRELLGILSRYDSSDDPQNKITFRKVLGIR